VAEHFLGKEEVKGSIPFNGSFFDKLRMKMYPMSLIEALLNRERNAEECDATNVDSSNAAGFIIKKQ
jgi:hypothetical protein